MVIIMELREGIVIKSSKYLDNSKIVNILTEEGLFSYLVKSGMKLTNKANSYTQDVTLINYDFQKGKGFDILTSGKVLETFSIIKTDLKRIEYMYLIIELIVEFHQHVSDNSLLYSLTKFTLNKMNESKYYKYYYQVFALKLLYLLGIGPEFRKCVKCGGNESIIGFDYNSSGMICSKCSNSQELIYSNEVIKYAIVFYLTKLNNFSDEYIENLLNGSDIFDRLSSFINRYYQTYLGFSSKTIRVFNKINN